MTLLLPVTVVGKSLLIYTWAINGTPTRLYCPYGSSGCRESAIIWLSSIYASCTWLACCWVCGRRWWWWWWESSDLSHRPCVTLFVSGAQRPAGLASALSTLLGTTPPCPVKPASKGLLGVDPWLTMRPEAGLLSPALPQPRNAIRAGPSPDQTRLLRLYAMFSLLISWLTPCRKEFKWHSWKTS